MAALVLLCGCGRSAEMSAEDVRAHFASLDSCTAHLKIISDLDESVLEFESDYVYNREDSDSFTLTAPESVAGIGGRISGEENGAFTLQYNDLQLDDIAPRHTGLYRWNPVSKSGAKRFCWSDENNGSKSTPHLGGDRPRCDRA